MVWWDERSFQDNCGDSTNAAVIRATVDLEDAYQRYTTAAEGTYSEIKRPRPKKRCLVQRTSAARSEGSDPLGRH